MPRVIAIDGPAGSGKSTTARAVAERLEFAHLDSGSLYRALTMAALAAEVPIEGQRVVALARGLPVRLMLTAAGFRPEIAGVDVSTATRSDLVTRLVSRVAALPAVREAVTAMLREAAALHPRGVVMDGRDIGTVVFPDAGLKVFLTATPGERARRRLAQEGREVGEEAVRREADALEARDAADAGRALAPLRQADDAIVLETTGMTFADQVAAVVALARKAFP